MIKIGILGGGQLGRMMFQETIGLDLDLHFLDQDKSFPVGRIAENFTVGDFTNYDDVFAFAKDLDVITVEIEKVNLEALIELEKQGKKVHPNPQALKIIQDKADQKQFYLENQFPSSVFARYDDKKAVLSAVNSNDIQLPFVQKARKDGYDGKGVAVIRERKDLDNLLDCPCIVEPLVDIKKELAVIACRNEAGEVVTYSPVEMVFDPVANLVKYLYSPADIDGAFAQKCKSIAEELIGKFNICGLLAVEFFLTNDGEILINEVAPRPHNSGHHTIDASVCSQFENHIRAVANLPLGATRQYEKAAMINILGEAGFHGYRIYIGLEDILKLEDVHIHLYGKEITKPSRKMGHINVLGQTRDEIEKKIEIIDKYFKVIA